MNIKLTSSITRIHHSWERRARGIRQQQLSIRLRHAFRIHTSIAWYCLDYQQATYCQVLQPTLLMTSLSDIVFL